MLYCPMLSGRLRILNPDKGVILERVVKRVDVRSELITAASGFASLRSRLCDSKHCSLGPIKPLSLPPLAILPAPVVLCPAPLSTWIVLHIDATQV